MNSQSDDLELLKNQNKRFAKRSTWLIASLSICILIAIVLAITTAIFWSLVKDSLRQKVDAEALLYKTRREAANAMTAAVQAKEEASNLGYVGGYYACANGQSPNRQKLLAARDVLAAFRREFPEGKKANTPGVPEEGVMYFHSMADWVDRQLVK